MKSRDYVEVAAPSLKKGAFQGDNYSGFDISA